jgi:hypothetical protein
MSSAWCSSSSARSSTFLVNRRSWYYSVAGFSVAGLTIPAVVPESSGMGSVNGTLDPYSCSMISYSLRGCSVGVLSVGILVLGVGFIQCHVPLS